MPTSRVRQFTQNTAWQIFQNVFAIVIGIVINALVTRYFSRADYGKFNYVSAVVSILTAFATLGLDSLTVKAIVDKEYKEGTVLCTSFFLRIFGGIFLTICSSIIIRILRPGDSLLQSMTVVLSASMVFKATETIDYWAQAYLKSKITSIARMLSLVLTSAYKMYVVFTKGNIFEYTFANLLDAVVVGVFLMTAYFAVRTDRSKWRFSGKYAVDILKKCWYLVISGLMVTVYMQIDRIMLGSVPNNDDQIALYGLASMYAAMWYFVPGAIITSFKSIIMEYHARHDKEKYEYHIIGLYSVIIYVSVLFAIGISVFSPFIVSIINGPKYAATPPILIISIWGGVFAMLGSARQVWLICENLQKYTIVYSVTGCVMNILLNLMLIPALNATGAAIATVLTQFANIACFLFFKEVRVSVFMMVKALNPSYLIENLDRLKEVFFKKKRVG